MRLSVLQNVPHTTYNDILIYLNQKRFKYERYYGSDAASYITEFFYYMNDANNDLEKNYSRRL